MTLFTSGRFYAEVYTVGGTFVQGPLYNITRFRYDDVMDALSIWEMDMPLGDPYPRIAIQQHHLVVVTRLDDGALARVYSGIVDSVYVDTKTNIIKIKGFCRGRQLCWTPAGALDIWTEASQTFDSSLYDCYAGTQTTPTGGAIELTGGAGDGFPWDPFFLRGDYPSGLEHSSFLYFGRDRIWHDLTLAFSIVNTLSRTAQWQYYNGQTGGWANLTVVDGTVLAGAPMGQNGAVTFTAPDDWVAITHDGHDYYWIRVRVTEATATGNITVSAASCMVIVPTPTPFATFIIPILPAGWTLTGVGEPATPVFAQFTQESIFEVLVKIAQQTGEHFIINGTDIDWLGTTPMTGAIVRYLEQAEDIDDEMSAVVFDAAFTKETYDLISRVYPYGGGHSQAQVTLSKATDSAPAGYTLDLGDNYIAYNAAEDPSDPGYIGVIAKRIYCPEIGVETVEPPKDEHAANALLKKAAAYLSRRCTINTSYDISVAGLTSRLYPGQPVYVTFSKYYQGTQYIDIDERLIIVKFTEELSVEGIKHTVVVSTTDMLARTDAEKVAEYIEADYTTKAHPQSVPAKNLATTKGTNASVFANGKGGMILRDSALGSSGGSFTPAPHDLLSTLHGDTDPDIVVRGDIIIGNAAPEWARLPAGAPGDVLTMGAADPAWAAPGAGSAHAFLSATHTDTLVGTVVRGDILVGNATPAWARLAKGALDTILAMGADDPAWIAFPGLTPAAHTAIGDAAPHHAAVTLGASAAVLMDLTGQALSLDTQAANTVLAGRVDAGTALAPTFRALVALDLPSHAHTSAGTGGDFAWADITGFAVPSNTVKLSAVEGAATTVLRSDATLALDQSIAPTWTGAHIFKKTADSTTGIRVLDQDGNIILTIDSVNNRVGIGPVTPLLPLETRGPFGGPATSGITAIGIMSLTNSNVYRGIYFGITNNGTDYPGWIQVSDWNDLSQVRNLAINPRGGNVGIGTTNPNKRFTVRNSSNANDGIALQNPDWVSGSVGSAVYFDFGATSGDTYSRISTLKTGDTAWSDLVLQSGGGKVGIGMATPATILHVRGASGVQMTLDCTTGQYTQLNIANAGTARLNLGYDQTNTFGYLVDATGGIYLKTGNVGIGTTAPLARLDLASTVQASTRLLLSGQEFYAAGNTDTHGVAFLLGVNGTSNRQLWLGDSALLAVNNSNPIIRILPDAQIIDAIATDGATTKVLTLGNAAGVKLVGNLGFYGTTPITKRAHIADATNATDVITRVNAILLALEQYGLLATS